ncbi:MAG: hypothetical protein IKY72_04935 [Bacteroidaceae bacterium]|nr:hypothetical protein [Bacteroidaceae bacterium]
MKKFLMSFMAIIAIAAGTSTLSAQSREYIRNAISEWGECRNVAITKTNGDLALYGRNGCARSGCPRDLNDAIVELHDDGEYIDDIQLTEDGSWLILYGDNGLVWDDIPYSLERKLREYHDMQEVITSVTFNDAGNWIVITTNYFSSSHSEVNEWLKDGNEEYGQLWAACVTDDAIVAVFEDGYKFLGNVPESLKKALRETNLDVYRLKIAGTSWFFADKDGNYRYNM